MSCLDRNSIGCVGRMSSNQNIMINKMNDSIQEQLRIDYNNDLYNMAYEMHLLENDDDVVQLCINDLIDGQYSCDD